MASKKQLKKMRGKCGKHGTRCPQCYPAQARKAAGVIRPAPGTWLGKSASPAPVAAFGPKCAAGHVSKAGAKFCTTCGLPALGIVKNAGPSERDYFLAKVRGEADPRLREGWWAALQRSYGPGGAA